MGKLFARSGDAGFGAVSGVHISADLDLEMRQGRTVLWLEKKIENFAPLRFAIFGKEPRRSARAQTAEALENPPRFVRIEHDFRGRLRNGVGGK
jgi:hypothetical protein